MQFNIERDIFKDNSIEKVIWFTIFLKVRLFLFWDTILIKFKDGSIRYNTLLSDISFSPFLFIFVL